MINSTSLLIVGIIVAAIGLGAVIAAKKGWLK